MLSLLFPKRRPAARSKSKRLQTTSAEIFEVRSLPAAAISTVIQSAVQGIGQTGQAYGAAVAQASPTLTEANKLIAQGYQQNASDLAAAARTGDQAGIQRELRQNQELAQLSGTVSQGFGEYLRNLSTAYSATVNAYISAYNDALLNRVTTDQALANIQAIPGTVTPNISQVVSTASQAAATLQQTLQAKLAEFNNSGSTGNGGGGGTGGTITFNADTRVTDKSTLTSPYDLGNVTNKSSITLTGFVGQRFRETTSGSDINDLYTFTLSTPKQVQLTLQALNDPLSLDFENGTGQVLQSTTSTLTSDGIITRNLPAGTYRLRVINSVSDEFTSGRTHTYRVDLSLS